MGDNLMIGSALCGESSDGPHGVPGVYYSVGSRRNCQGLDAGRFFKGDIAEILVFNSSLNATELKAVSDYLAPKWGIPPPPAHNSCTPTTANCSAFWEESVSPGDQKNVTAFAKALQSNDILRQTVVADWANLMQGCVQSSTRTFFFLVCLAA